MSDLIGDARAAVFSALGGLGIPVHTYPPDTISPPAIVLIPGEPYLAGFTLNPATAIVRLQAQIVTAISAPEHMDSLIRETQQALTARGWPPDPVPPPRTDTALGVLICRVPVTLHWKE